MQRAGRERAMGSGVRGAQCDWPAAPLLRARAGPVSVLACRCERVSLCCRG